MIALERTSKKLNCPGCGQKRFKRYINQDTGEALDYNVGMCDRRDSCGYHYTPRQYFADNKPISANSFGYKQEPRRTYSKQTAQAEKEECSKQETQISYLDPKELTKTLRTDNNSFLSFLIKSFHDDLDVVYEVFRRYFVGTYEDYVCFPQIDVKKRIRGAKLIRFNPDTLTCKRLKGAYDVSSLQAQLKRRGIIAKDLNFSQCFFGEHLLPKYPDYPVAIVESEKSAIVGSICFPQFVWLATGSKQSLKAAKLINLGNRKYIFYPDGDGFDQWAAVAEELRSCGYSARVSTAIQQRADSDVKANGLDVADVLLIKQNEINELNELRAIYNQRLDLVQSDPSLFEYFNDCYNERLFLMEVDALPESEIRTIVCNITKGVRV